MDKLDEKYNIEDVLSEYDEIPYGYACNGNIGMKDGLDKYCCGNCSA